MVSYVGVCRVEGYRFDGDEELVWAWFWGEAGLELKGLAFGWGDGGEVSGHLGFWQEEVFELGDHDVGE